MHVEAYREKGVQGGFCSSQWEVLTQRLMSTGLGQDALKQICCPAPAGPDWKTVRTVRAGTTQSRLT